MPAGCPEHRGRPERNPGDRWSSTLALSAALAVLVGCWGASSGGGGHAAPPPGPAANAAGETLVQASGAAQSDASGVIENAAVVGEPITAGAISAAGATAVRYGFSPPIPPGWPTSVAAAPTVGSSSTPTE